MNTAVLKSDKAELFALNRRFNSMARNIENGIVIENDQIEMTINSIWLALWNVASLPVLTRQTKSDYTDLKSFQRLEAALGNRGYDVAAVEYQAGRALTERNTGHVADGLYSSASLRLKLQKRLI